MGHYLWNIFIQNCIYKTVLFFIIMATKYSFKINLFPFLQHRLPSSVLLLYGCLFLYSGSGLSRYHSTGQNRMPMCHILMSPLSTPTAHFRLKEKVRDSQFLGSYNMQATFVCNYSIFTDLASIVLLHKQPKCDLISSRPDSAEFHS